VRKDYFWGGDLSLATAETRDDMLMSDAGEQTSIFSRVIIASTLLVLTLKLFLMTTEISSLIQDLAVFFLLYQLVHLLRFRRLLQAVSFWLVYPIVFFATVLYTLNYELISLAEIEIDLTAALNVNLLSKVWRDILKVDHIVISAVGLLLSFVLGLTFPRWFNSLSRLIDTSSARCVGLTLVLVSVFLPVQNPFLETINSLFRSFPFNHIEQPREVSLDIVDSVDDPFKRRDFSHIQSLPVENIFLIVMETETVESFNRKRIENKNPFRENFIKESNFYSNFHTQNLGSRTSILAMLSGIFIPYRAYAVAWKEYKRTADNPDSLALFKRLGFASVYATSQADKPPLSRHLPWDHLILQEKFDLKRTDYLCLHAQKAERACEDISQVNSILAFMEESPRSFIMHPFIVNHSKQYLARLETDSLSYVFKYVEKLVDGLREIGKLESTAIVLVGDHGRRSRFTALKPESYRVPLLIWRYGRSGKDYRGFYSNTQFLEILLADLLDEQESLVEKEVIYLVGPSWMSVEGEVHSNGEYTIVNRSTGVVASNSPDKSAVGIMLQNFKSYLMRFRAWHER
jgi:hypothetical protein